MILASDSALAYQPSLLSGMLLRSTMPGQIVKECPLDFDLDLIVSIRLSFEPKLLFSFLAFKIRWKSTRGKAPGLSVFHRLNTPIGISMLSRSLDGILYQPFDGIDMALVKSPNRVVSPGQWLLLISSAPVSKLKIHFISIIYNCKGSQQRCRQRYICLIS
jgi:hypothetical protein